MLVDNGSRDDSVPRLRAAFPQVRLLPQGRNLGFTGGNNVGIRDELARRAEYILLLNNDTVVATDTIIALEEAARAAPKAGFLGAKIFYHAEPSRIWMGKPVWDPRACRFEHVGLNQEDAVAGLDAVDRPGVDAVLVTLVDVPLVRPATVRRLLAEYEARRAPIVRPARGDEHGHPVIFRRELFEEFRRADPAVGAKAVVRAHAASIVDLAVDDAGAFADIDTPDDYARLVPGGQ